MKLLLILNFIHGIRKVLCMLNLNKVMLIGRLGKDPELKRTPTGSGVTSFSLATSERYIDKSGQKQEKTEWHNIVAWNKSAELAAQYLKKGSSVYVEGKLTTRSWDDQSGNKRYTTEVVVQSMQFLDSKQQQQQDQQPQQENDLPF